MHGYGFDLLIASPAPPGRRSIRDRSTRIPSLSMYEISEGGLTLQVELGAEPPDQVENADGWIMLPDGQAWSATFLTYGELGRIFDRWQATGECLNGTYFTCPDLVLTRRPGVREMFASVQDLVAHGDHEMTFRRAELP